MNLLYFDSIGGASGDMILAALIDLGVSRDELQRQLASLPVEPFDIQAMPFQSHGLRGLQVNIQTEHDSNRSEHNHAHHFSHRRLPEIQALIAQSNLPARVKETSLNVFQRLAEAEARVHGTTPDKVQFHEVGAVDSIVDIVGACLGLELLSINAVAVSTLPLGHGTVTTVHGVLPVPAPATVELLQGMSVTPADESFELVTPTGAALLSTWTSHEQRVPARPDSGRLQRVGHGFGHHPLTSRPNLLRAMIMDYDPAAAPTDECLMLECNLDDTIPELLGSLTTQLLTAGALDTFLIPVQMKKQRPGILLTVLCRREHREALIDLIFKESTTFGIREYPVQRTILQRKHEKVTTPYGKVRVKTGTWQGQIITRAPEHDDCVCLAQQAGVSIRAVYEAAAQAVRQS